MKQLPVLVFAALLFITACNSSDKKSDGKKDKYEETKETLAETEKKNPVRFLSVTAKDKKNLFSQTVVKGEVMNHATIAIYTDVQLKILYYSKTGTLLLESPATVYEKILPGGSASFKSKEWAPKGTDSVALKVVGAKSE